MTNTPPFHITPIVLSKSQEISRILGELAGAKLIPIPVSLRRENKIKTIHSSLAIEGNVLSVEQVTAILAGKRVIGPEQDIKEVHNAEKVYEDLKRWNPLSLNDLIEAHKILMKDLIDESGQFRSGNVGIFQAKTIVHVAPPAKKVPELMENLFEFIGANEEIPWLIKACIFHYELEFIHPFQDGNGRIGRLWQQLLLMKEDAIFEFLSIESVIKSSQKRYYDVLAQSDKAGESTVFIEFSLEIILEVLRAYADSTPVQVLDGNSRLEYMKGLIGNQWFTRKEYIDAQKNISTATASRDLQKGVEAGLLIREGDVNQSRYRFVLSSSSP